MRQKFDSSEGANVQGSDKVEQNQGAARAISSFIDPGLSWKDLDFFKSITKMPLILKGVQCWEVRPTRLRDCDRSLNPSSPAGRRAGSRGGHRWSGSQQSRW